MGLQQSFLTRIPFMQDKTVTSYRADIDGLRAIAVMAVVASHAAPSAVTGGFVGVDVFFIISGYLITGNILADAGRGRFSLLAFYARRVRRLFPALLLVLAAVWIAGWLLLLPDDFEVLGRHLAASAGFVPNFMFWRDLTASDQDVTIDVLLHLWSLGVEEQYYLVWPVIVLAMFGRWSRVARLTAILLLFSFALNIVLTFDLTEAAFYLPFPRFWELLVGSVLAFVAAYAREIPGRANLCIALATERTSRYLNDAKAWTGFALIAVAIFGLTKEHMFPGFWVLIPVAGTALLIASGPDAAVNRLLSNRGLVAIGLISYPFYLWHWPLLSLAEYSSDRYLPTIARLVIALLALPLAWLTYRYVEIPVRYAASEQGRTIATRLLMLGMAAIFVLGILTYLNNGFGWRLLL